LSATPTPPRGRQRRTGGRGADQTGRASLLDDPATTDLGAKVTQAWALFGQALASVLGTLPAGSGLDITLDPTAAGVSEAVYDVSVTAGEGSELHAHAVSNAMLPPEFRLPRAVIGELVELGWSPPALEGDDRFSLSSPTRRSGGAIVTARSRRRQRIRRSCAAGGHHGQESLDLPTLSAATADRRR
jgi:hypothetical protein